MSQNDEITWRDNRIVLWLVRIGFLLQFYIPAGVCCYILIMTVGDMSFTGGFIQIFSGLTLTLLAVQWAVFASILRFVKLRSAWHILGCLIVVNVIHGGIWLWIDWPYTMGRLAPPTVFFLIAMIAESGVFKNASHPHP